MTTIVALDGISGSGKTTVARILRLYLSHRGYKVLLINEKEYEPFRSWAISWHKRSIAERVFMWQDVVDVARARAIVHESLFVAITQSDFVFFDRSLLTSAVYQSSARISPEEIVSVNLSFGAIKPEVVFLFLGKAEICYERIQLRSKKKSSYNLPATTETLEQLREYLERYRVLRESFENAVVVDAILPTASKAKLILGALYTRFSPKNYGIDKTREI